LRPLLIGIGDSNERARLHVLLYLTKILKTYLEDRRRYDIIYGETKFGELVYD